MRRMHPTQPTVHPRARPRRRLRIMALRSAGAYPDNEHLSVARLSRRCLSEVGDYALLHVSPYWANHRQRKPQCLCVRYVSAINWPSPRGRATAPSRHQPLTLAVDLVPMAMESDALHASILSLASAHMSLTNNELSTVALQVRSTALQSLRTAVETAMTRGASHETNAAACLTLVIGEVCVGNFGSWHNHLNAARHIIQSAVTSSSNGTALHGTDAFRGSSEGRWLLRNFAYHDIIGSVTMRRRPLVDPAYLNGITDVVDSYLGVATGLLIHIGRVSLFAADLRQREQESSEFVIRESDSLGWTALEHDLWAWECPQETRQVFIDMALAYKYASIILLYRIARRHPSLKARANAGSSYTQADIAAATESISAIIENLVNKTLAQVEYISVGTFAEAGVLFPLFIAGGETARDDQIEMIRSRLRLTLEKRKFQNISQALDVLEAVWARRQNPQPGARVEWEQVLDDSRAELILT